MSRNLSENHHCCNIDRMFTKLTSPEDISYISIQSQTIPIWHDSHRKPQGCGKHSWSGDPESTGSCQNHVEEAKEDGSTKLHDNVQDGAPVPHLRTECSR